MVKAGLDATAILIAIGFVLAGYLFTFCCTSQSSESNSECKKPIDSETSAIIVTIGLAFTGYIATYLIQRTESRHRAQLERVNLQLRNLYGPLYAQLKADEALWLRFKDDSWPAHGGSEYFGEGLVTTEEENERWRIWMTKVWQPMFSSIEKAILENGDLLDSGEMSKGMINMVSYIASYRAVFARWEEGDFSVHKSLLNFPFEVKEEVETTYRYLIRRQEELRGGHRLYF